MMTDFSPGDRVRMRKKHPCGSNEWIITGAAADISLQCAGCGRSLRLSRSALRRKRKNSIIIHTTDQS
jgi:hypothetical protein